MKEVTKVKVTMEVEVITDEIDLFHTSLESAVIEFSKNTGANILKVEIKEKCQKSFMRFVSLSYVCAEQS